MKISKAAEEGGRSRRMGRGHGVAQCACTSIHYSTGRRFTSWRMLWAKGEAGIDGQ